MIVITKQLGSVQSHFVQAREIIDDVLCLKSNTSLTKRAYRTVLHIDPINFLLKSEEDQTALLERYRLFLKSLTFPVQILVCNAALDMQSYRERIESQTPFGSDWATLASALQAHLTELGTRRALLSRHMYLIIPAPEFGKVVRHRFVSPKQRALQNQHLLKNALEELRLRTNMIASHLSALRVGVKRLRGGELATFYASCLTPQRALTHPLQEDHLALVGRLPRGIWPSPPLISTQNEMHHPLKKTPGETEQMPQGVDEREQAQVKRRNPSHPSDLPPFDLLRLADLLAPGHIEEHADAIQVGDEWMHGIAITAFPREIAMGSWLAPLLLHDEAMTISFHLHPQDQAQVIRQLRARRAGYASTRLFNRKQGRLDDPQSDLASHDINQLLARLVSGDERLYEVSLLVLVRASDRKLLEERTARVMTLLHTILLDAVAHPTTFEHAQALRSVLPECRDALGRTIALDTTSVASTFPFHTNSLIMPEGTFLGMTGASEPVFLDPWESSLQNPHTFIGGVTGAGKSYLAKLWLERSLLMNGTRRERIAVIDPDGEYGPLARSLGGAIVRLAPGSEHHLNPFDLLFPGYDLETYQQTMQGVDRLKEKIQDLLRLLDVMLANPGTVLDQSEKALLELALYKVYRRAGITADLSTHANTPPLLSELWEVLLSGLCGSDDTKLAPRLRRYVNGSLSGLFASHTNAPLDSHLLVWDVRDLRGELLPIGMFLISDAIWTQMLYQHQVRRCLFIDEAATLLSHKEGGELLETLARRSRKRYLRLVVATQNPEKFVTDKYGSIVASNAAIQILKAQDRTSVQAVSTCFGLTRAESMRLLALNVDEALLLTGDRRVLLSMPTSQQEHALFTTNPVELANASHPQNDALAPRSHLVQKNTATPRRNENRRGIRKRGNGRTGLVKALPRTEDEELNPLESQESRESQEFGTEVEE